MGASRAELHQADWDRVIRPQSRLLDLPLRELWEYRGLVWLFVRRDFVTRFKQTILGPLWILINPLLSTLVFTIVFGNIAKLPTDGIPPMLFYLSGNVMWGYFAACVTVTSNTFTANAAIFGKVYFPRLTIPISKVASGLIEFAVQFLLFIGFLTYFALRGASVEISVYALLLPLQVLVMAGLGLGAGMILSAMTSKYRDLQGLVGFGLRLFMYATVVIYPLSTVEQPYRGWLLLNPMTSVIESFRLGFLGQGSLSWLYLGYSAGLAAVLMLVGMLIFSRVERTFMDTV